MIGSFTSRFTLLVRGAVQQWNERRHRRMALRDIEALDDIERGRISREAGLAPWELRAIMRKRDFSQDLLSAAMTVIGIDANALRLRKSQWHAYMQRECTRCPARNRCRRDVADRSFIQNYPSYCLNAGSLSEIAATLRSAGD